MIRNFKTVAICLLILFASVCEAESLCKTSEKVIFSCMVQNGKKLVSVCSSTKLTKDVGYLQYRFGTKSKTELEYPSTTQNTQEKFYWRYMRGSEGAGGDLSFKNHEYLYTVSRADAYDDNSVMPGGVTGGIIITSAGEAKTQHHLKCDGVPDGDFYILLNGIVKDEEDLIESK